MKNTRLLTIICLICFLAQMPPGMAATSAQKEADLQAVRGLQAELDRAGKELTSLTAARQSLETKMNSDLAEVKKLKLELAAEEGFLKQRKLARLLKRSRDAIDEVAQLSAEEDVLRREMLKYAAAVMLIYNKLIDAALISSRGAAGEEDLSELAGWIILRQEARQTYFNLRAIQAQLPGPTTKAVDISGAEKNIEVARLILVQRVSAIDKRLLLLEEQLEDLRTERSHWTRMKRLMHRKSRQRGDPLLDDAGIDDLAAASDILDREGELEDIELGIRKLEVSRKELRKERAAAHKLMKRLGEGK